MVFENKQIKYDNLAGYIDNTLLKPDLSVEEYIVFVEKSINKGFYSICLPPSIVPFVYEYLKNDKISTVIGFPNGYSTTKSKIFEIEEILNYNVSCVDCVININFIKSKNTKYLENEIKEIRKITKNKELRIIIETCYLENEEKIYITKLLMENDVDVVKTSTGFGKGGATIDDVILLKSIVGNRMKIKASGGIKERDFAIRLLENGADIIGTSNGLLLI